MFSTQELYNKRVYLEDTNKCVGRVRTFIFYAKKCVCLQIKRPDVLLMFRRKPVFIDIDKFTLKEKGLFVRKKRDFKKQTQDKTAIWKDAPIFLSGKKLGYCGNVNFESGTGKIINIELAESKIQGALLGKTIIESTDIKGYDLKKNKIILNDTVNLESLSTGLAEKAGKTTSKVIHKIKSNDKMNMFKEFKEEFDKGLKE